MITFLREHLLAFVVGAVFFTAFLVILFVKHSFQFQTFGMDLGFYDQIIYKASLGDFTKSTIAEVLDRNYFLSFFENDFHIPLLAIALFYRVYPSVNWIFIFQAAFSCLVGLGLYFAAFQKTKNRFFSLVLLISVFISVPFQHVIFDGFTPEVFGAFFLTLVFWALFAGRNTLALVFGLGVLISKVEFSPILAIVGLCLLFFEKKYRLGIIFLCSGVAWFIFLVYFLNPWISPEYQNYAHRSLGYGQIGSSPAEVIGNVFTNPVMVLKAVMEPSIKLRYLLEQLVSFGFLPLGAVQLWMLLGFELFTRMGNNVMIAKWPLHSYTITVTLAVGTIYVFSFLSKKIRPQIISAYLLAAAVAGMVFFHAPTNSLFKPDFYRVPRWVSDNREALKQVPRGVPVAANNSLVPHLSTRSKIYVFPNVSDANFIILDLRDHPNAFVPLTFQQAKAEYERLVFEKKFVQKAKIGEAVILERL